MATRASRIALAGSNISSTGEVDADTLDNLDNVDFARTSGVSTSFISDSYNILEVRTDNNDDQTSTDGIFKITNGSAGTTKAEFRWDESEDLVHTSYGDHGRHISIASNGNVGIGTGSTQPATELDVAGTVTANQYNNDAALPTVRPSLLLDFANSKTLDPRITFARAGVGTYYDGKSTTKAEENILINSEAFGSWPAFGSNGTLTSGFTSPTGTSTAWRLQYPQGTGGTYLQQTFSTKVGSSYTMSVYAKENASGSQFTLRTDGSVISSAFSTSSSWQRYSFTFTAALTTHMIEIDNTSAAATDILIWGAQVEENSHESVYIPTTSTPVVKYQPKLKTAGVDEPRFDHDPITRESKGLLIEESRTNYSGSTAPTGTYQATQRAEYGIAPDGTQTAIGYEVGSNTVGGSTLIYWPNSGGASSADGINVTQSVYVKPLTGTIVRLLDNTQNKDGIFLLTGEGSVTGGTATTKTITHVGNQWYRITMSYTMSGTGSYIQLYTYETGLQGDIAFLTWGYQREIGSFATSFIKSGGGSSTTRAVDQATIDDISWYDNSGTLFVDFNMTGDTTGTYGSIIQLVENSNTRWGFIMTNSDNALKPIIYDAPNLTFPSIGTLTYGTDMQLSMTSPNGTQVINSINGGNVITTAATAFPEPTSLYIGKTISDNNNFTGTFKKIAYYPQRLPNATLQAMTEE